MLSHRNIIIHDTFRGGIASYYFDANKVTRQPMDAVASSARISCQYDKLFLTLNTLWWLQILYLLLPHPRHHYRCGPPMSPQTELHRKYSYYHQIIAHTHTHTDIPSIRYINHDSVRLNSVGILWRIYRRQCCRRFQWLNVNMDLTYSEHFV